MSDAPMLEQLPAAAQAALDHLNALVSARATAGADMFATTGTPVVAVVGGIVSDA